MNYKLLAMLSFSTILYLLAINPPAEQYIGYTMMNPKTMVGFSKSDQPKDMLLPQSGWEADISSKDREIITDNFKLLSSRVSFDVLTYGCSLVNLRIIIQSADKIAVSHQQVQFQMPVYDLGPTLKAIFVDFPNEFVGKDVSLSIKLDEFVSPQSSFSIRDRLDFFRPLEPEAASFMGKAHSLRYYFSVRPGIKMVIAFLLGCACWLVMRNLIRRPIAISYRELTILVLIFSSVAWRSSVFFYWDEWHALNRFIEEGIAAIRYVHNEHFLPVFWLIYYAQILLWGDWYQGYILVSFAVHIINSLLLFLMLKELCPRDKENAAIWTNVRAVVTLFYAINPLHAEVLHWSFVQCVLLQQTALLVALCSLFKYLRSGRILQIAILTLCTLFAPFLFGNGFAFAFVLPLAAVAWYFLDFFNRSDQLDSKSRLFEGSYLIVFAKRCGLTILMLLITLGFGAYQYSIHKEGFGHTLDIKLSSYNPFENSKAIVEYLFVGSQFGGVLRGLALFPSLKPYAAHSLERHFPINGNYSELILAGVGISVSFVILAFIYLCKTRERRISIALWFLAQGLLITNVLLPALARFNFGVVQSLALRYQSAAVLGLSIMVLSAMITLRSCYANPAGLVWMWGKIISIGLLFWCILAVMMWTKFEEWSGKGEQNYAFLQKERAWRKERGQHRVPSERRWSEAPTLPTHLTPGFWPKDMVDLLDKAKEQSVWYRLSSKQSPPPPR